MANPSIRKAQSALRDASEDVNQATKDVVDRAAEFYDQATSWLSENRGRALGIAAAVATVGVAGFFIGRKILSQDKGSKVADILE